MGLRYLTQSGSQNLDLTTDGNTDTVDLYSLGQLIADLQIVRSQVDKVGNPLLSFEISSNNIDWVCWEIGGFIFKDDSHIFEIERVKNTFFRISWLSNSSTGTFTANFNLIK